MGYVILSSCKKKKKIVTENANYLIKVPNHKWNNYKCALIKLCECGLPQKYVVSPHLFLCDDTTPY